MNLLVRSSLAIILCFVLLPPHSSNADTANDLITKYKRAVVKLTITGTGADGRQKPPSAGSGFVIHSGKRNSLILTAAHVVGSNDRRQISNPDWLVEPDGRTLSRQIKVELLDERGALISLGEDASVVHQDDQKDVALLLIDRTGLSTIPFAERVSEIQGELQKVLLFGFPKDEKRLNFYDSSGRFQSSHRHGLAFRLNIRIPEGFSGGPVIDLANGKVFALASENIGTGNEHHAATLFPVVPNISPYLTFVDKVNVSAGAEPFTDTQAGPINRQVINGNCNIAFQDVSGSTVTISGSQNCQ
jgi:S1-C subfamily serine protease